MAHVAIQRAFAEGVRGHTLDADGDLDAVAAAVVQRVFQRAVSTAALRSVREIVAADLHVVRMYKDLKATRDRVRRHARTRHAFHTLAAMPKWTHTSLFRAGLVRYTTRELLKGNAAQALLALREK